MWIECKDRNPIETGQYQVETNHGKSIAFFIRKMNGKLEWMTVNEDYKVIKWLFE